MGKPDFKASNGWLESLKKRHNIASAVAWDESVGISEDTVSDWTGHVPNLCSGYEVKDIFNLDETGVFYRPLPDRTLTVPAKDCHGGKRSKDHLIAVLCYSMTGEMLQPLIIGKAENPRCRHLVERLLARHLEGHEKAWVTTQLFKEWLTDLNKQMRHQHRHILLFLDNAPSHPQALAFFLPNTTSKLQPLDQGIIPNFVVFNRQRLLCHVLCRVDGDVSCRRWEVLQRPGCLSADGSCSKAGQGSNHHSLLSAC